MAHVGAKGRQICAPSSVRGSSTPVRAVGLTRILPRTRDTKGGEPISFTEITNSSPVQLSEDGPTVKLSEVCRRAVRPLSVMVKRPPGP